MADLTCPKCQSPMRSYERNGVTIDQCTGCRGVFLDRGELERLVDAEGAYYASAGGDRDRDRGRERHERDDDDRERGRRQETPFGYGGGGHGRHRKHKREGFLGDLFDFG
jgi:hypothetical protein